MPIARSPFNSMLSKASASTVSIRQFATFDPNPANGANLNLNNLGGTLYGYVAIPVSDTASGSTLVAFAEIAYDGNPLNTVHGVSDPINGAWTALDALTDNNGFITTTAQTFILQNAQALKTVAWSGTGHISGGSFTVDSTTSGSLHLGDVIQGAGITGTPVVLISGTGPSYTINNDATTQSLSTQSVTAANAVLVNFNSFNDYQGMVVLEVSGVPASSLAGHTAQLVHATDTTPDSASSGTTACGSTPVALIGFGYNGAELVSPYAPVAGTGFTSGGTALVYDRGQPALRWEYKMVSNPGSAAATFTPAGADWYNVFLVAVKTQ